LGPIGYTNIGMLYYYEPVDQPSNDYYINLDVNNITIMHAHSCNVIVSKPLSETPPEKRNKHALLCDHRNILLQYAMNYIRALSQNNASPLEILNKLNGLKSYEELLNPPPELCTGFAQMTRDQSQSSQGNSQQRF
jgi:hypothetical protein